MQVTDVPTLAGPDVRTQRQLYRLVDLQAAAAASAALQAAAARKREDGGVFAIALKSADAILRAAGNEDALRDQLRDAVTSPEFLSAIRSRIGELREIASSKSDTGACTLATALELWLWTMNHLRAPQAIDDLAGAVCPLLASSCFAIETASNDIELRRDLCHVQTASASAAAAATCAELVFGYERHLVWDAEGCATCYAEGELDDLEAIMPGIASGARTTPDILGADGSHPMKEGPCVRFDGFSKFMKLRNRLDGCLTGARIAKDRAARTIAHSAGRA